jgi:hypothetical protein
VAQEPRWSEVEIESPRGDELEYNRLRTDPEGSSLIAAGIGGSLMPTQFDVRRVETFLGGEPCTELRRIWAALEGERFDMAQIARILVPVSGDPDDEDTRDAWTAAKGEAGRRDLWRAIQTHEVATSALERLDEAAAAVLEIARSQADDGPLLRPGGIANLLTDLLPGLRSLRTMIRAEAQAERLVTTAPPRGRPSSWHREVDEALARLRVPRAKARALVKIVAGWHDIEPRYSRGGR